MSSVPTKEEIRRWARGPRCSQCLGPVRSPAFRYVDQLMLLCRDCLRWAEAHEALGGDFDDPRHEWWTWESMRLGAKADYIDVIDPGLEWAINRADCNGDVR